MNKKELIASLDEKIQEEISLRFGLDDGYLLVGRQSLFFVTERMGTWQVIEQWKRTDIQKWQISSSFMGDELAIMTKNGRSMFRKFEEDYDWGTLFQISAQRKAPKLEFYKESKASKEATQKKEGQKKGSNSRRIERNTQAKPPIPVSPPPFQEKHELRIDEETSSLSSYFENKLKEIQSQKEDEIEFIEAEQSNDSPQFLHERMGKKTPEEILEEAKNAKKGCGCAKWLVWFWVLSFIFGLMSDFL